MTAPQSEERRALQEVRDASAVNPDARSWSSWVAFDRAIERLTAALDELDRLRGVVEYIAGVELIPEGTVVRPDAAGYQKPSEAAPHFIEMARAARQTGEGAKGQ